ncbi:MAG: hypothetical protein KDE24_04320, partial [Caldilinea sp.]|nr:hypothetical protein [Caldilinea sp.]
RNSSHFACKLVSTLIPFNTSFGVVHGQHRPCRVAAIIAEGYRHCAARRIVVSLIRLRPGDVALQPAAGAGLTGENYVTILRP